MPRNYADGVAGDYVLMAEEWHKPNGDGSYTVYEKGETVTLTAADATRFFAPGSVRFAFKKVEGTNNPGTTSGAK